MERDVGKGSLHDTVLAQIEPRQGVAIAEARWNLNNIVLLQQDFLQFGVFFELDIHYFFDFVGDKQNTL